MLFFLERLLAWCQESSLLPFLPWDTTHHHKDSWQLPGCPAWSPSLRTTWGCCPSQNHTCFSMSCPLMARSYPTSWKGAVSVPAPHRGGHRALGPLGNAFLPTSSMKVCGSSPWTNLLGCSGARSPCWRSAARSCHSPMDVGKRHRGPERSSSSPWGAAHSVETLPFHQDPLPSETLHQQPCERTGILLSHETLDDPICTDGLGQERYLG